MDQVIEQQPTVLSWRPYAKLSFIIVWVILFSFASISLIISIWTKGKPKSQSVLLISPMRFTKFTGLGNVSEPLVNLKLKTTQGYEGYDFLLDSGAVISSLPYEMAEKMDQNLIYLPRLALTGYGNATTFAYQGTMMIDMKGNIFTLPVVFTNSETTKFLLGRKGFFDQFSVNFNNTNNTIEIKQ